MVNNDREISQREAEINEIAKSIFQLSDLFKELQNMVVEQGTMLDRIDYNIDQTVVHVKQGHKELVQVYPCWDVCLPTVLAYWGIGRGVPKKRSREILYLILGLTCVHPDSWPHCQGARKQQLNKKSMTRTTNRL